jgi:hypothetical protein
MISLSILHEDRTELSFATRTDDLIEIIIPRVVAVR